MAQTAIITGTQGGLHGIGGRSWLDIAIAYCAFITLPKVYFTILVCEKGKREESAHDVSILSPPSFLSPDPLPPASSSSLTSSSDAFLAASSSSFAFFS